MQQQPRRQQRAPTKARKASRGNGEAGEGTEKTKMMTCQSRRSGPGQTTRRLWALRCPRLHCGLQKCDRSATAVQTTDGPQIHRRICSMC